VNQLFYENTADSDYATFFFAEYDDNTRLLRYANCGHLSALILRRNDTFQPLDSNSTVLGLFEEWNCSIEEQRLFPGDTLALYTDGITESSNDAGEEFGEQRLREVLAATHSFAALLLAVMAAGAPHYPLPDLKECMAANLAAARLTNPKVKFVGAAINTKGLDDAAVAGVLIHQLGQREIHLRRPRCATRRARITSRGRIARNAAAF
jgi:serine/threonine protein phosphatase PrpC